MVGTLSSGGHLKLYFLNRAEHYMRENRTRLQQFLETIALLAESYIVVAVAMPLFLIVMLVIMFWVSGSGAQMSEGMLYGIVLGFIPMIHLAYAVLVYTSSKVGRLLKMILATIILQNLVATSNHPTKQMNRVQYYRMELINWNGRKVHGSTLSQKARPLMSLVCQNRTKAL